MELVKRLLLLLFFSIHLTETNSQMKPIAISQIKSVRLNEMRCMDTSGVISRYCSLDLDGLFVAFYAAFIDQIKKEFRLIGRVTMGQNGFGLPNVVIFKATKIGNRFLNRFQVGESTEGKNFIENSGFFDITFTFKKGESLIFHHTSHFLQEYLISKLLIK